MVYQPAGLLKQHRWLELLSRLILKLAFPSLWDNFETVFELSKLGQNNNQTFGVYIDINTGMNRTGIDFKSNWDEVMCKIAELSNIQLLGEFIFTTDICMVREKRAYAALEAFEIIKDKLYSVEQN